jgi:chromosome partitioning protein
VAKTSLTMNIGYQLSQQGNRVLLVDLDPQASLTIFMGLESHELERPLAR